MLPGRSTSTGYKARLRAGPAPGRCGACSTTGSSPVGRSCQPGSTSCTASYSISWPTSCHPAVLSLRSSLDRSGAVGAARPPDPDVSRQGHSQDRDRPAVVQITTSTAPTPSTSKQNCAAKDTGHSAHRPPEDRLTPEGTRFAPLLRGPRSPPRDGPPAPTRRRYWPAARARALLVARPSRTFVFVNTTSSEPTLVQTTTDRSVTTLGCTSGINAPVVVQTTTESDRCRQRRRRADPGDRFGRRTGSPR